MPTDKMLAYALKETETAVRIMFRDRSTMHVYDLGKGDGVDLCMVLLVVSKTAVEALEKHLGVRPSIPLVEDDTLTSQCPFCFYEAPLPGFSGVCPECGKDTTEEIKKIRRLQ